MKRLRGVALGSLALLALAAAPSIASAAGFTAEDFPATLTGTQEGSSTFVFESGPKLKVVCSSATFTASISEAAESSETLRATPSYKECKAAGLAATVTTTGCALILHGGEETAENEFSGSVDVSCEAGKAITVSSSFFACKVQIESQSGLSSVKFTDHTASSPPNFTAATNLAKMKYTVTEGAECPLTAGSKENGTLSQTQLVTGATAEASVGVFVLDPTKLCKALEAKCAGGNTYGNETFIEASATNSLFKAGALEITCGESSLTGKNTAVEGDPLLPATIETLSFGKCVEKGTMNACTVAPLAVPLSARFAELAKGNGMMFALLLKLRVICATAPFNCDFGKDTIKFTANGGNPASLEIPAADPVVMALVPRKSEEKCTKTISWSGTYSVAKPKPLYLTN